MQPENKNDGVQLSDRYLQYTFAKRHFGGVPERKVFPIGESSGEDIESDRQGTGKPSQAITAQGGNRQPKVLAHYGHKEKTPTEHDISPTLKAQSHGHEPMVKTQSVPEIFVPSCFGECIEYEEECNCPLVPDTGAKIRRLTPLECERLMGLPDDWTAGQSDTQRYKLCGNGVVVNVVEAVVRKLFNLTL